MEHLNQNEDRRGKPPTPIQTFFADTNVFVTGGSGFLGMLLLEKLLSACPNICRIYMLVRSKKGKNVSERLDGLFEDAVFCRVREQDPNFRNKIVGVEGDCELQDLGINDQDRAMLIQQVNVVFHVAATVRFDEALKKASFINVRAVRDIMRLAQQMNNLKSFVHVSTAYSNCIHKFIKEEIYPPAMDYRHLLMMTKTLPVQSLDSIAPTLVGKYPNTYSFTKQIGEDVVRQEGKGLPIGIHRPSIVLSTYNEPLRGWINNFYGPNGVIIAGGIGLIRTFCIKPDIEAHFVPADFVVNSIIAAAWDVAQNHAQNENKTSDVMVYNFECSEAPKLTWDSYIRNCMSHGLEYFSLKCIWYMIYLPCENYLGYAIMSFFLEQIPAFLIDTVRFCMAKPPMVLKILKKIYKMSDLTNFFVWNQWKFSTDNVRRLKSKMSQQDQNIFFCEMKGLDWNDYLKYNVLGCRIYLLKDPVETLPEGLKKLTRLYWLHQITKYTLIVISVWILWSLISLLMKLMF